MRERNRSKRREAGVREEDRRCKREGKSDGLGEGWGKREDCVQSSRSGRERTLDAAVLPDLRPSACHTGQRVSEIEREGVGGGREREHVGESCRMQEREG